MALPKITDARNLSDEQLDAEILAVKRQLFQLRLLQATRRLEKPHEFKHARHRLAQLMTVEAERKRASSAEAQAPAKSAGRESGPVEE
jgi:large subunit ribosomal protein L29